MKARASGKLRMIDRFLGLFGVVAATRHDQAIASAETAIGASLSVRTKAEELTDMIRQLDSTLHGR